MDTRRVPKVSFPDPKANRGPIQYTRQFCFDKIVETMSDESISDEVREEVISLWRKEMRFAETQK
jgi:hypothetical protein